MEETPARPSGDDPAPQRPAPSGIAEIVDCLLAAADRDGGSWRVPADAADRTYVKLVDRIVRGSPPADPRSWARQVLVNSLKSGPERAELQSAALGDLPENTASSEPSDETEHPSVATRRRILERLGGEALRVLTEAERAAFQAMLTQRTMAAAARACGMTRRDLRVRSDAISRKLRALLEPGPPLADPDSSVDTEE